MSGEAFLISRSWKVGRYECTLFVPNVEPGSVVSIAVEWSPDFPERLTRAEMSEYRAGRDEAMAAASKALGGRIGVIEI